MCLIYNTIKEIPKEKPIIGYKFFNYTRGFYSPCIGSGPYYFNKNYKASINGEEKTNEEILIENKKGYKLTSGAFHFYTSQDDALAHEWLWSGIAVKCLFWGRCYLWKENGKAIMEAAATNMKLVKRINSTI